MFKHNFLVFLGLLGTALAGACGVGAIGDAGGEARLGPESGAFDGGVGLSPEAAAEFSEDPVPGVVERSAPDTPNTAMQPEEPIAQACSSAAPDLSASNGWRSIQASQAAFDTLRFEFMVRPAAANLNGLVAIGARDIEEFTDVAISVRFTGSGLIDARDGSAYASDTLFGYDPGVWYQISISADIGAQTYDVAVGRCGEPTQALITGAAFRSDASVSNQLTTWALWSSQSAMIELSTPMWIASGSCAPATCQSLGSECGQPSDGCGSSVNCGSCGSGEVCVSGLCVDNSTPPPPVDPTPPAPPGGGPSGPADSCAVNANGFCCEEGFSFSQCSTKARYVRPGGGGAQDGSDWANALSGLPSVLERDTVYWLGAGNYGSYTFDDGASGQMGITVRKATAEAHGSDTGWNAAYGSGQAVFGPLRFAGSRYTLDGGEPNGLRTIGQMGTKATVLIDGSHIVLRHVEIDGGLQKSNGTQTAGGCNGSDVNGDYVVFDRCEIHNIADDGLGIYADHVKVLYSKVHDLHACGTDGRCSGPCYNGHSDGLELSGVSDIELVGNMVYDIRGTAALFMDNWSGSDVYDLVVYNNVFYAPDTGLPVYLQELHGAKVHNNIIWGKTQGNRYGGLSMGKSVTGLEMYNNIILNINYSHMGASYDPSQHKLDYNLFGMINSGEYPANSHDLVGDPQFADIPMSSNAGDHKGSNLVLDDFVPGANAAIDTGTTPSGIPAYDIDGQDRPQGGAWDRGPFEGP